MGNRYHSSVTGKFVSKEFAEANPDTTVKLSTVNLREELVKFAYYLAGNFDEFKGITIEDIVDQYLKEKGK